MAGPLWLANKRPKIDFGNSRYATDHPWPHQGPFGDACVEDDRESEASEAGVIA